MHALTISPLTKKEPSRLMGSRSIVMNVAFGTIVLMAAVFSTACAPGVKHERGQRRGGAWGEISRISIRYSVAHPTLPAAGRLLQRLFASGS